MSNRHINGCEIPELTLYRYSAKQQELSTRSIVDEFKKKTKTRLNKSCTILSRQNIKISSRTNCNRYSNRTEWTPIRSLIIIGRPRSGSPIILFNEYDYRPNWTTRSLITN